MHRTTYILLFVLLFFSLPSMGQELEVKSFNFVPTSLIASAQPRSDSNGKPCAVLRVQIPLEGATFEDGYLVGDVKSGVSEYILYMAEGARKVTIRVPGYLPLTLRFRDYNREDAELSSKQDYILVIVPASLDSSKGNSRKSGFYFEAGGVFGSLMGADLSVGTILGGFNIELGATLPFGMSEQLWWNHPTQESIQCSYKPSLSMSGRLGYAVRIGDKFGIIPQVGMRLLKTSETVGDGSDQHAAGANVSSLLVAAKLQYMFSKHIGLSLTPEYALPLLKSEAFKDISTTSSKIHKWNNGIDVRLSLQVAF